MAHSKLFQLPTIFKQLYAIHGSVGSNENSRIMPLVFSLMSSKSMECYQALFQNLINFGDEHNIDLQPQFVLTDFEAAAINAVRIEFQGSKTRVAIFIFHKVYIVKYKHLALPLNMQVMKTLVYLLDISQHLPFCLTMTSQLLLMN